MLDIRDLERRWLKYKIKSYAPLGLGVAVALAVTIGAASWILSEPKGQPTTDIPPKTAPKKVPLPRSVEPAPEEKTTVLEPSMEFVQTFEQTPSTTQTAPFPEPKIPAASLPKKGASASPSLPVPPPKVLSMPDTPIHTAPAASTAKGTGRTLSINRNDSKLDIDELQKRFKETSNPNLGLFIARYYYDRGEYGEAYNYALKTNSINDKIDESWVLFAKSLVKMGKTEQAIQTLQLYVRQSNSESAKGLLESIEKGTFK